MRMRWCCCPAATCCTRSASCHGRTPAPGVAAGVNLRLARCARQAWCPKAHISMRTTRAATLLVYGGGCHRAPRWYDAHVQQEQCASLVSCKITYIVVTVTTIFCATRYVWLRTGRGGTSTWSRSACPGAALPCSRQLAGLARRWRRAAGWCSTAPCILPCAPWGVHRTA